MPWGESFLYSDLSTTSCSFVNVVLLFQPLQSRLKLVKWLKNLTNLKSFKLFLKATQAFRNFIELWQIQSLCLWHLSKAMKPISVVVLGTLYWQWGELRTSQTWLYSHLKQLSYMGWVQDTMLKPLLETALSLEANISRDGCQHTGEGPAISWAAG